jgi:hypothetical protein
MSVFVKNQRGEPLMLTTDRKARLLLKECKAKVYSYEPYTIQLCYATGETTQEVVVGIDPGAKTIGAAIVSKDRVLLKGEINLRDDVKKNLKTRNSYRSGRRHRNTRYRKPRFKNRKRDDCWLPPSIQSKVCHTINWINKFLALVPNPKLVIEQAKFDAHKLDIPEVEGAGYQLGTMYGYRNRIAYLLAREKAKCQYCKKRHETGNKWRLHHIWGKEHDRPEDWVLIHEECHIAIHANKEEKLLQKKKPKSYKESTFMNIIRKRLYDAFPEATFTYGNITHQDRLDLKLDKTHYNDAIATTGIKIIKSNPDTYMLINQVRIKKRSLHEATARKFKRPKKNTESKRNEKNTPHRFGLYLNDRVEVYGKKGFVTGFSKSGVYVKDCYGQYITKEGKNYNNIQAKGIRRLSYARGWQFTTHLNAAAF